MRVAELINNLKALDGRAFVVMEGRDNGLIEVALAYRAYAEDDEGDLYRWVPEAVGRENKGSKLDVVLLS